MNFLNNLYEVKEELNCLESGNSDYLDKIEELEESIALVHKKKTRGFITDDEAKEELEKLELRINALKEKMKDDN